ncbi:hypothetical protein ACF08M_08190 [Streptomyces sp. NPDC015032]|uniref:hypothetical protein n=1 Tax=Streptomyces sp. NPDC015032 TaxID=3364937 RepID=UPI0036F653FE
MFQETPIYCRLLAERGDVPAQVRGEAERIQHSLAQVIPSGNVPVTSLPEQRNDSPWQEHWSRPGV